ncbi:MAG: acyltransferase domain-containing protein, partial [Acidobacteriota bacterium]|nr:acyltransferase domain-containing protein [Acidobacteriota bacterium]
MAEAPEGARYLRTGDLGVLRDGELYVCGRLKDLIIVRGQNHHPHDVELAASEGGSQLRPGCLAAFDVDRGRGQEVILVAELARELEDGAGARLFEHVRARVARDVAIALDELVLIERGASLKTSSGKIRRAATRAAYLDGHLSVLARYRSSRAAARDGHANGDGTTGEGAAHGSSGGSGRTREPRERRLAECSPREREEILHGLVLTHLSALLGEVSPEAMAARLTFTELGLESPDAVELSHRLREETGLDLPDTLCYDQSTPAALVSHLSERLGGVERHAPPAGSPATTEPVAIVGMGCRLPGGVESAESLWGLVASGADAISQFPHDRGWDLERLFAVDPDDPGTSYTRQGGFLQDAAGFDAEFFSISPREALAMDPQQRLLLEGAWEAFEAAGIDPTGLKGSSTGVFAGVIYQDYAAGSLPAELEGYMATGAGGGVVTGRIAYTLGLEGPAVTVDTACSSSLVAIHYACQALRHGECTLALAGGVTVFASPGGFVALSRQRVLSPDGRCKAFGAGADGMGAAEGMGMVVLERLSDAQRNGHRVLALIRGSAINQDGASNGLTAPSGSSQERVIGQALANAGLRPQEIDAVEAHGTGTALGDPIEARALLATYGRERAGGPLYLGSIKSNVGHTQAAAGVAGVIKMVKALEHGVLPRTLHAVEPTPQVDWRAGDVALLSEPRPWPEHGRPRRCAVSSFGISGTNAHLILEQAPEPTPAESSDGETLAGLSPSLPFVISAGSAEALGAQAERLRSHLLAHPELELASVASTLALGRPHLCRRAAVLAESRAALLAGLEDLARGEPAEALVEGSARGPAKVAFCFSGQGSQWEGMALQLWDASPVFAEGMEACSEALRAHLGISLAELLRRKKGAPAIERVDMLQPALFAVMVSLAALWRSFGVEPAAVVGHSQGEIAAACAAGALSLEDAARVVALRARALADELSGRGGMVSIALPQERVGTLIEPFGERLALAAVNGPSAAVVSGEPAALRELLALCAAEEVRAKAIPVDYASHSTQVEAIRGRLAGELAGLATRRSEVPFYSATAGAALDTRELDGAYWFRNLRETVRFEDAAGALLDSGCNVVIEVSPHPVLTVALQETAEARGHDGAVAIGSLRRGEGGIDRFLRSLAEAHVHGAGVDWRTLFGGGGARPVDLPTYPFQRRRYWLAPQAGAGEPSSLGQAPAEHPLLGAIVPLAEGEGTVFTGRLSLDSHPWLADHAVMDTPLLPGTAFLELALTAAERLGAGSIEELTLHAPLLLGEDGEARQLQLSVSEP